MSKEAISAEWTAIDWRPFLEWKNKNSTREEREFISDCIGEENITGLWGYLLKFFDSIEMYVEVKSGTHLFEFRHSIWYRGKGTRSSRKNLNREEAWIEPTIKAFKIYKKNKEND